MSFEIFATTHLQGLKHQSQLLHAVELLSLELLDCKLKFIYSGFWLALKGKVKFAVSTMYAVVLFADRHPPEGDKDTNNVIPKATFTYCCGSHIRIEQEAILGSLPQAGSGQWNQPFLSPVLFHSNQETNVDFVA